MENNESTSHEGFINVRYNLTFSISLTLVSITLFILGVSGIVPQVLKEHPALWRLFWILFMLLSIEGIYRIFGKKLRYDVRNKRLYYCRFLSKIEIVHDKLFVKEKDLFIEIKGKIKKYSNLCNKKDLDILFQEINKG
jgi:hypothetical protein